jgi:hypothetical protein
LRLAILEALEFLELIEFLGAPFISFPFPNWLLLNVPSLIILLSVSY